MSYTVLTGIGMALAVFVDVVALRTKLLRRRMFWTAYTIMACFQLIVNGVLTGVGVVRYNPAEHLSIRIVHAPVEDLGFGFAIILLTLSSWIALGRHADIPIRRR